MAGAVAYFFMLKTAMPVVASNIIALVLIFALRMWAIVHKINLPTINKDTNK
jgi:uncharacterized membrane protein YeiH